MSSSNTDWPAEVGCFVLPSRAFLVTGYRKYLVKQRDRFSLNFMLLLFVKNCYIPKFITKTVVF
jgi:hypothetical protein